jgi:division protein CdvB (Snf7/Vps24/ESCRT-III family)
MRSHLQGCALKLQTVKSHQAMAEAMQSTGKAMAKMNKAVNVTSISKMMAEFEKENAKTEMMQEIMGDAIDDVMEGEDNEEEEDRIVGQVLDEISPLGKICRRRQAWDFRVDQCRRDLPKCRPLPVATILLSVSWKRD